MATVDASTGAVIDDLADLRQSIAIILTTPIGTRVMRRDFGSMLFELVDSPSNRVGALRLFAATADALERWEPRFHLTTVSVSTGGDGRTVLRVAGEQRATGQPLTADVAL
ncbi:GPW/gp25 family protein [Azospirillum argentinense]